jgi:hypothetical protein
MSLVSNQWSIKYTVTAAQRGLLLFTSLSLTLLHGSKKEKESIKSI